MSVCDKALYLFCSNDKVLWFYMLMCVIKRWGKVLQKRFFMNEVLLLLSVPFYYGAVILFLLLFGKVGLFSWTVICTIGANIEVLILINAFGMEQTLGNVLFASSFLVTDILSENFGKQQAKKAVSLGVAVTIFFVLATTLWLKYTPCENDVYFPFVYKVFSSTPRVMLSGGAAYIISQFFDVFAYHKWWSWTQKHFANKKKFLWLRNNGSTLLSQAVNTLCFTFLAFYKVYDFDVLVGILVSTYVIYVFTSLLDTPFVYLARFLCNKYNINYD